MPYKRGEKRAAYISLHSVFIVTPIVVTVALLSEHWPLVISKVAVVAGIPPPVVVHSHFFLQETDTMLIIAIAKRAMTVFFIKVNVSYRPLTHRL